MQKKNVLSASLFPDSQQIVLNTNRRGPGPVIGTVRRHVRTFREAKDGGMLSSMACPAVRMQVQEEACKLFPHAYIVSYLATYLLRTKLRDNTRNGGCARFSARAIHTHLRDSVPHLGMQVFSRYFSIRRQAGRCQSRGGDNWRNMAVLLGDKVYLSHALVSPCRQELRRLGGSVSVFGVWWAADGLAVCLTSQLGGLLR
jgi:hypothetical protein